MRSFVINLERATERRFQFCEQAARCGWPVEVFPAIDWKDLEIRVTGQGHHVTHRHLREVSLTGVPLPEGALTLRAGHYACALSHMALWRKMLAEGDEWIGIFEDDAIIRGGFVEALPEDADFVFLGDGARVRMPAGMTRHSRDYIDRCRDNPYAPLVPGSGTFAYIVSRRGAEKGLSLMQPMFRPIDLQIMACGHGTAEARHPLRLQRLPNLPECRIYAATVPCARHRDGGKSYVNEDERSPDPCPGSSPAGTKCRKVVIGLGTGRCGTQSFASLMAMQPGVSSSCHERIHLPWLGADDPVWQKQAESLLGPAGGAVPGTIHCEVGLWYLPYVPHLLAVAASLGIDLKCVVLERPEEEVVASFCARWGRTAITGSRIPGILIPMMRVSRSSCLTSQGRKRSEGIAGPIGPGAGNWRRPAATGSGSSRPHGFHRRTKRQRCWNGVAFPRRG